MKLTQEAAWRAEREVIDAARIRRAKDINGSWRREWDGHKEAEHTSNDDKKNRNHKGRTKKEPRVKSQRRPAEKERRNGTSASAIQREPKNEEEDERSDSDNDSYETGRDLDLSSIPTGTIQYQSLVNASFYSQSLFFKASTITLRTSVSPFAFLLRC